MISEGLAVNLKPIPSETETWLCLESMKAFIWLGVSVSDRAYFRLDLSSSSKNFCWVLALLTSLSEPFILFMFLSIIDEMVYFLSVRDRG